MTAPSEVQLLRAWQGGDAEAGRELFDRVFARLRRFFRSKVDPHHADDLIQRTLLAALERVATLDDDRRFNAYLFTVARHELFAAVRRQHRTPEAFDSQRVSAQMLVPSPTGLLAQRDDERMLLAALRRIPLDLQIALELYYWEGMRTADVGAVLGIGPSTTTTRLARARALLRQQLAALGQSGVSTQGDLEDWVRGIKENIAEADESPPRDSTSS